LAVAAYAGAVYEQAWHIRGMEARLQDMDVRPELAHFLFDHTTYYQMKFQGK
jgi:hypothetical protein